MSEKYQFLSRKQKLEKISEPFKKQGVEDAPKLEVTEESEATDAKPNFFDSVKSKFSEAVYGKENAEGRDFGEQIGAGLKKLKKKKIE